MIRACPGATAVADDLFARSAKKTSFAIGSFSDDLAFRELLRARLLGYLTFDALTATCRSA
jgi:hypothetical protein